MSPMTIYETERREIARLTAKVAEATLRLPRYAVTAEREELLAYAIRLDDHLGAISRAERAGGLLPPRPLTPGSVAVLLETPAVATPARVSGIEAAAGVQFDDLEGSM